MMTEPDSTMCSMPNSAFRPARSAGRNRDLVGEVPLTLFQGRTGRRKIEVQRKTIQYYFYTRELCTEGKKLRCTAFLLSSAIPRSLFPCHALFQHSLGGLHPPLVSVLPSRYDSQNPFRHPEIILLTFVACDLKTGMARPWMNDPVAGGSRCCRLCSKVCLIGGKTE